MKEKYKILNALRYESIAWIGGKTSFQLSEELGLHINTVRRNLRLMNKEREIYSCCPHSWHRLDGHTANTPIWFRGDPY